MELLPINSGLTQHPGQRSSWINSFCSAPQNKYYCSVPMNFIERNISFLGLQHHFSKGYTQALDSIMSKEGANMDIHNINAVKLYGLIHAQFLSSAEGLSHMKEKYLQHAYGSCSTSACLDQALLPVGCHCDPGLSTLQLFCPSCSKTYHSTLSVMIDGAYFCRAFAHPEFLKTKRASISPSPSSSLPSPPPSPSPAHTATVAPRSLLPSANDLAAAVSDTPRCGDEVWGHIAASDRRHKRHRRDSSPHSDFSLFTDITVTTTAVKVEQPQGVCVGMGVGVGMKIARDSTAKNESYSSFMSSSECMTSADELKIVDQVKMDKEKRKERKRDSSYKALTHSCPASHRPTSPSPSPSPSSTMASCLHIIKPIAAAPTTTTTSPNIAIHSPTAPPVTSTTATAATAVASSHGVSSNIRTDTPISTPTRTIHTPTRATSTPTPIPSSSMLRPVHEPVHLASVQMDCPEPALVTSEDISYPEGLSEGLSEGLPEGLPESLPEGLHAFCPPNICSPDDCSPQYKAQVVLQFKVLVQLRLLQQREAAKLQRILDEQKSQLKLLAQINARVQIAENFRCVNMQAMEAQARAHPVARAAALAHNYIPHQRQPDSLVRQMIIAAEPASETRAESDSYEHSSTREPTAPVSAPALLPVPVPVPAPVPVPVSELTDSDEDYALNALPLLVPTSQLLPCKYKYMLKRKRDGSPSAALQ